MSEPTINELEERLRVAEAQVEILKADMASAADAIEHPCNHKALSDTLWMPNMQACTIVDFLNVSSGRYV